MNTSVFGARGGFFQAVQIGDIVEGEATGEPPMFPFFSSVMQLTKIGAVPVCALTANPRRSWVEPLRIRPILSLWTDQFLDTVLYVVCRTFF